MKYFDYFFKTSIIIICIVFLILFYNFTKLKYIKVMVIPDNSHNAKIIVDDSKNEIKFIERMSKDDEMIFNYHFQKK
jgi:hypothetical protein